MDSAAEQRRAVGQPKLSKSDRAAIAARLVSGDLHTKIAQDYGVSRMTINRIAREMGPFVEKPTVKITAVDRLVDYICPTKRPKIGRDLGIGEEYVPLAERLLNMSHDLVTAAAIGASNAVKLHGLAQARLDQMAEGKDKNGRGLEPHETFEGALSDDAAAILKPIMAATTAANAAAQGALDLLRLNIDAVRLSEEKIAGKPDGATPRIEVVFKSPQNTA